MIQATPATLSSVLAKAVGGDTIELGAGDYGAVSLSKRSFDPPLTIRGRPDAVIGSLNAVQCKGLVFEALAVRFKPTATTLSYHSAVRFFQCEGVVLRGSSLIGGPAVNGVPQDAIKLDSTGNVTGLPTGYGLWLHQCRDVIVTGNALSAFFRGVVLADVDGLSMTNNDITDLRTSPITGGDVDNVTIERNHLGGSTPWRYGLPGGDHGDYIHLWTVPARATRAIRSGASKKIVIRDNFLEQGAGQPMMGIYLDDNNLRIGFENVLIEGNVILNAMRQAIQVECTTGRIVRNTMVTPVEIADKRFLPTVMVWDHSVVEIIDNIMGKVPAVETLGARIERIDANVSFLAEQAREARARK